MNQNIRIAILDSGLSAEYRLPENVRILGKRSFCYDYLTASVREDTKTEDLNGHGTMCVSTILNQFTNVDFYIIRMLSASGMTNEAVFLRALEYAYSTDADIISVCSSFIDGKKSVRIKAVCAEIAARQKIMITSVRNGETISEPASYDTVIGVRGGMLPDNRYRFCPENPIQMQCAQESVLSRGLFGNRTQFQGTSRSAALATAHIASAVFLHPDQKANLSALLQAGSSKPEPDVTYAGDDLYVRAVFDAQLEEQLAETDETYLRFLYLLCELFLCDDPQVIRSVNLIDFKSRFFLRKSEICLRVIEEAFGIHLGEPRTYDLQYAYLFYNHLIKPAIQRGTK